MLFCSQTFLVFFTCIFVLYWAIPWQRTRIWLLLAASFYFYASWNHWLALLIGVTTALDYLIARGIAATESHRGRLSLLLLSLVINLGLLTYFKYANFFLHSLEEAVIAAGGSVSLPVLQVILPVGISFYTFEAINYVVDVYRRRIPAERNLANFMLFITFFPHLVAGPIVRARDFLPQIRRRKHWDWCRVQLGIEWFLLGLIKKVAIADRMALFVDPVFKDPEQYRTSALWVALVAYVLQLYGDFSGYSDMAVGAAHMLGYKLARNFNMPYLARNIAEFWHRWHMSLSTWLRDYLFIPLGGSRHGFLRTARNLLLTMTLGGLWHGAQWNFVVFGILHGGFLVIHRGFQQIAASLGFLRRLGPTVAGAILGWLITMTVFALSLVVFRAASLGEAGTIFAHLLVRHAGKPSAIPECSLWLALGMLALGHALGKYPRWHQWIDRLPAPTLGFAYGLLATFVLVVAPPAGKMFIYFQF